MAGDGGVLAERLLSTQRAVNSHLAALEPPHELVPGLMRTLCEMLGWSFGAFWTPSGSGGEALEITALWHEPRPSLQSFAADCSSVRMRRGEGLVGTIWETRKPAWIANVQEASLPHSPLPLPAGLRSVFAFPLALDDRLSGILEFLSEEAREPEPELVENFHLVGIQLAQYLERWQVRSELREREAEARQVVESLAEGVIVLDSELRVTNLNAAAERLLGVEARALMGGADQVTWSTRLYYENGTPVTWENNAAREVLETGEPRLSVLVRVEREDGEAWLDTNAHPLPRGGVVVSFVDVTERRRAVSEQRRLARIVESTDDAILSKDRNMVIRSWNSGAEQLYGYSAEEAVGSSVKMLIPPHRRGEEIELLDHVLQGERVRRYETERVRKDGSLVDVSLTVSPMRDASGQTVGASVIARDITQRTKAERELREERDRAERYLNMSGSIIVAVDAEGRATMINSAGLRILGLTEEAVVGADWFDLVFPVEVRENLRVRFRDVVAGGDIDQSQLGYYETPVLSSKGEERRVAWMTTVMRDSLGRTVGMLSSGTDITEHLRSEAAMAHLAYHDQVTGLPNRALLEEHLEVGAARAGREQSELALLYLDLDNFKMVNDSLGHAAGDTLLGMVAERLSRITRGSDVVARQGGDEFLILLTDLDDGTEGAAEALADKILVAFKDPFTIGDAEFEIGASVGIAIFPRDGNTPSALLRSADSAMYRAKAAGRGRYARHRVATNGDVDLLSTTARLRRALAQEELVLYYQPIFEVPDRGLVAVEALLRWNDPARGLVGPAEFIQLAEDTGLIDPIGEWVIQAICRQATDWQAAGLDIQIHFNLSPRQLRRREALERIQRTVEEEGVAPDMLTVEITESAAMADAEVEAGRSVLNQLRRLGVHLSVDDFGSGYSSLARLRQLPVDELKLDRSFLREVPHDAEAGALVRAVIDLANGLGMDTVVEGVETAEQWNFLAGQGRLLAQGFHLARPAPADQVTMMLQQARRTA